MTQNIDTAVIRTRQKDDGTWEVSIDAGESWQGDYSTEAAAHDDAIDLIEEAVDQLIKSFLP